MTCAPVIIGAGLAGLVTALRCAERGVPVVVLSAGELGTGAASAWAQGGIAAALGSDDTPGLHAADTIAAGAGLCDPDVVEEITAAAPGAVDYLTGLGARFDRHPDGTVRLGLEGAHSRHRIVHARGDGTGAEVMRAVVSAVRATRSIQVIERARAHRLLVESGRLTGVVVEVSGSLIRVPAGAVVLATGGAGSLWRHTTNPRGSRGTGLALAARAGAELRDLEMIQFHPTALDVGLDPMPLVSEAVRGAGAQLVDGVGRPLTGDPLAARDVVARLVAEASREGRVYLDARRAIGASFGRRFPGVAAAARAADVDPATDLVPVRPAAHYHCGGVSVDRRGRTGVPGLWAVGEVASTGLHGANRLASNSLLEAVVCGSRVAEDLARCGTTRSHSTRGPRTQAEMRVSVTAPEAGTAGRGVPLDDLRALMSGTVGLLRDGVALEALEQSLRESAGNDPDGADDATLVALLVAHSARRRRETRGGHTRLDHPHTAPVAEHVTTTLAGALAGVADGRAGVDVPEPILEGVAR